MNARTIRILLVDDHPLILSGITALLTGHDGIEVVGTAADAEGAWQAIDRLRPDLVIVDGTLPGASGIQLMARLRAAYPDMLALALTLHEEGPYIREFLKAGANGFVLKRSAADDLLRAIRAVAQGGTYIDPAVASKIFMPESPRRQTHREELSDREESVVRLVAEGFSNKEISRRLSLSVKTVETYRARALEKLQLTTRSALVRHALEAGWLATAALPSDYTAAPH